MSTIAYAYKNHGQFSHSTVPPYESALATEEKKAQAKWLEEKRVRDRKYVQELRKDVTAQAKAARTLQKADKAQLSPAEWGQSYALKETNKYPKRLEQASRKREPVLRKMPR